MTYQDYLQSEQWQKLREIVIEKQGGQCEYCGRDIKHVHHKEYPKRWEDDSVSNLQGVCGKCHMELHQIGKPERHVVQESIWDYVLVEVSPKINRHGRIVKPLNQKQCKHDRPKACRHNSGECDYYAGMMECPYEEGKEYVICDTLEEDEW